MNESPQNRGGKNELVHHGELLQQIRNRIQHAQTKATLSVNAEMIQLY